MGHVFHGTSPHLLGLSFAARSTDALHQTLASLASLRSNCMKRRVGALLVRSKRILSTGYNGTPRGLTNCNEGGCRRCNGSAKGGEARESRFALRPLLKRDVGEC